MFSIFYIFIAKSKFHIRILLEINFSSCRQFRDTMAGTKVDEFINKSLFRAAIRVPYERIRYSR